MGHAEGKSVARILLPAHYAHTLANTWQRSSRLMVGNILLYFGAKLWDIHNKQNCLRCVAIMLFFACF